MSVGKTEDKKILEFFELKEKQCCIDKIAYEKWLCFLTPLKWFTVGGGVILSALAGFTVLNQPQFLGNNWALVSGVSALSASVLTGLHTTLKCDSHQTECHRLIQAFSSLEIAFQAAKTVESQHLSLKRDELKNRLQELIEQAGATPARWCRKRAEKIVAEQGR